MAAPSTPGSTFRSTLRDGSTLPPVVLPYGTWPSPLSAADLAAGSVVPGNLLAAGRRLLWTERRPAEDGRQALVGWDGREVADQVPAGFDVRTRVHEYGGAPFTIAGDAVYASEYTDQRLYRLGGRHPRPVTAGGEGPAAVRWADARHVPDTRLLVAVRETHHGGREPRNEIVTLDVDTGEEQVLLAGRDFVASPRPSPDGSRLAWTAWDHPSMPWDDAELWVAELVDGQLEDPRCIAGGDRTSACSAAWMPDGRLAFGLDTSGYWEVHVSADTRTSEQVSWFDADCGAPAWQLGMQSIAPLADGRLVCVLTERATHRMVLLAPDSGEVTEVSLPYAHLDRIQPFGRGVTFLAAEANGARVVVVWTPGRPAIEVRRYELPVLEQGDHPVPEPIEVGTPDGETHPRLPVAPRQPRRHRPRRRAPTPARVHPRRPDRATSPRSSRPRSPTGPRAGSRSPTSTTAAAAGSAAPTATACSATGASSTSSTPSPSPAPWPSTGVVDGERMAIRGGSAGGYTTLAVLTTPGHPFACGTSFFGVADLELLAEHTHKFESRYLDRVVGPLPEARELYRQRSPLHRAEQLSKPLLVLQGLEDPVVPPEQAEAMVAAAAEQGVPHAYIAFEGEQHGFRRAEHIVTWLESELAFYGQVMGFTPAGDLDEVALSPPLPA